MRLLTTRAKDIKIDQLDWPRCGVCHMPVENFAAIDTGYSLSFLTQCHGQQEIIEVPDDVWDDAILTHTDIGTAFGDKDE